MAIAQAAGILALDNSYTDLPEQFYARVAPTPVVTPRLIRFNHTLAEQLGLNAQALTAPEGVRILAGNRVPEGADPLALAYAGHQFGQFVPQLGDGRAILLGECIDRHGQRRDIQLKGAGRTPFSRMGDGRAVLGPVLREYIVSEAMAGLGIPTTRALAMVSTGEQLRRETMQPGAILTRVASSHVRVGTFEYFHRRVDAGSVRVLADHVIDRLYPDLAGADNPYAALLDAVAERTGKLIAQWLLVGFIHGVMNTDNASIAGETLDYGPCAFMDSYNAAQVYSSIDLHGRYAYDQQPTIGQWNMARLAECLVPLLADNDEQAIDRARDSLALYQTTFEQHYSHGLAAKIGLAQQREGDDKLVAGLLECMAEQGADFTLTFRRLTDVTFDREATQAPVHELFAEATGLRAWLTRWQQRLTAQKIDAHQRRLLMRSVDPAYIPRNHRVQQVIDAAGNDDWQPLDNLLTVVTTPFEDHPELAQYAQPPQPAEIVQRTFCGT